MCHYLVMAHDHRCYKKCVWDHHRGSLYCVKASFRLYKRSFINLKEQGHYKPEFTYHLSKGKSSGAFYMKGPL